MGSFLSRVREELSTPRTLHLATGMIAALVIVSFVVEVGRSFDFNMLLVAPLASGTFTLFYNPDGEFASVRKFVGGITLGAVAGYLSLSFLGPSGLTASAAIALTAFFVWATRTVEPTSFTAAHLAIVTGNASLEYVAGMFLATSIVAVFFYFWKTRFYDQRADYLYESTWSDDNVLVPFLGEFEYDVVEMGSKIAAAHEGGRVVLLRIVDESGEAAAEELERIAEHVRSEFGVFVEVSVVEGDSNDPDVVRDAANRYSCDIVALPWMAEPSDGTVELSGYLRKIFNSPDFDVAVYRPQHDPVSEIDGITDRGWGSVLTPVKKVNSLAFLIVDIGTRLAGVGGEVTVSRAIGSGKKRKSVQDELFDLTSTFEGRFETRVANVTDSNARDFIVRESREYDIMVIGASSGLGIASRFLKTPTVELIAEDIEVPVVVVNRHESGGVFPKVPRPSGYMDYVAELRRK